MDGIILVNKPEGYTSHDIVAIIRKKLKIKKVGHTGTLDPHATGVLPILVGNATKISKFLIEHDKTYIAILKLGKKTTTGDNEGEILEEREIIKKYNDKEIQTVFDSFLGEQEQIPPIYSAIKINGKKAYEYARQNKTVEIKPRLINIYYLKMLKNTLDEITFEVKCSKGTYIRTLCEDIASKLGNIGYMKSLTRTKVDNFSIEDAVELKNVSEQNIIGIEKIFTDKDDIELDDKKLHMFLNGVKIKTNLSNESYRIYNKGTFIGLGTVNNKILKRDVIILDSAK